MDTCIRPSSTITKNILAGFGVNINVSQKNAQIFDVIGGVFDVVDVYLENK